MLDIVAYFFMVSGALLATIGVVLIFGVYILLAADETKNDIKLLIQRRADRKLFKNIEEFRNDFA